MRAHDGETNLAPVQPRAANAEFASALRSGLTKSEKRIPSRFFYDARGSALFEQITTLDEYYPTRVEREILDRHGASIAATLASDGVFVEFGSGSSKKTELLLRRLPDLSAYIPIDVSHDALRDAGARLSETFPALPILPIVGDFSKPIALPDIASQHARIGFFPGSTIGNFYPLHATKLLQAMALTLGKNADLIVGYDLKKSEQTLNAAYNDTAGVTAAFNKNILAHANRALQTNFDLDAFSHYAAFDPDTGGIDMYLVSNRDQTVVLDGQAFSIADGERIHTEHSHKYSEDEFAAVATAAGWTPAQTWSDPDHMMAITRLTS